MGLASGYLVGGGIKMLCVDDLITDVFNVGSALGSSAEREAEVF